MKRSKKSSGGLGSRSKRSGRSGRFDEHDGGTDQPRSSSPPARVTPLVAPQVPKLILYPLSRQAPSLARPQNSAAISPSGGRPPVVTSWLWNNVIPVPGVAVMTGTSGSVLSLVAINIAATVSAGNLWPTSDRAAPGDVVWLSSERAMMAMLEPELATAGAFRQRVRILEAGADAFGLAVRNFESGVQRLRELLQGTSRVRVVIVDHFLAGSEPGRPEADVQRLSAALSSLHQAAAQFGTAVVLLYQLADRDIITITKAITAFKFSPEVQAVFVIGLRGSRGVLLIEKSAAKIVSNEFPFRKTTKNSIKTLMWDSRSQKDL
jgi:hypothetical protein